MLFGHVTRSSGMAEAVLKITVKQKKKKRCKRKMWEDNIKEWAGMYFASSS